MPCYCVTQFNYDAPTKVFTQEMSTLSCPSVPRFVTLYNPQTGNEARFIFTHADKDGSGEDTYGYNYVITQGSVELTPSFQATGCC